MSISFWGSIHKSSCLVFDVDVYDLYLSPCVFCAVGRWSGFVSDVFELISAFVCFALLEGRRELKLPAYTIAIIKWPPSKRGAGGGSATHKEPT